MHGMAGFCLGQGILVGDRTVAQRLQQPGLAVADVGQLRCGIFQRGAGFASLGLRRHQAGLRCGGL